MTTAARPRLHLRAATAADAREWARLRQRLWPDCAPARSRLEIRELLGEPGRFGVLVLDRGGGRLGGFAELALRDGVDGAKRGTTAYLEGWYVEPDLRRRGWGRRLVAAAEAWSRRRGMVELASDCELGNTDALAAHVALGFRETFRVVQLLKPLRRRRARRRDLSPES